MAKRIAVVGSCGGVGKTTLARARAHKIGGTFVEFDSLRHGPNWTSTPDDEIRASLAPVVATERWTIDAIAEKKVGRLVLDRVELIAWLDLPPSVWIPRLAWRSARRWLFREELWNGNAKRYAAFSSSATACFHTHRFPRPGAARSTRSSKGG